MKAFKIIFVITLAGILFSGCKEKHKIEIVPNLDAIYLPIDKVDVPPKELNGLDTLYKNDITNIIKSYSIANPKYPVEYKIDLRLYINENGTIQMIKNIGSEIRYTNSSEQIDYGTMNKILVALSDGMENWKLQPALKNGKPVKSRTDFNVRMIDSADGKYYVKVGALFNNTMVLDHFLPVDKEPQVKMGWMPNYPETAKRNGIEGTAFVKILVGADGIPEKAIVIKSDNEIFNQTSIDAAMHFIFSPAVKDNDPLAVWVVIPFKYKLSDSEGKQMPHK